MQILDSGYLGVSDSDNGFDISKLNLVGVSKLNLYETARLIKYHGFYREFRL